MCILSRRLNVALIAIYFEQSHFAVKMALKEGETVLV